jgi:hypothetical protein
VGVLTYPVLLFLSAPNLKSRMLQFDAAATLVKKQTGKVNTRPILKVQHLRNNVSVSL